MPRCTLSMLLALLPATSGRYEAIAFPGSCATDTFFDISALACLACPDGMTADAAGTSCICADGKVQQGESCVSCDATNTAPTADRTACLPCTINTTETCSAVSELQTLGFDAETAECNCPTGQVAVDRDAFGGLLDAKTCRPCPKGTYAASATSCAACPEAHMVAATGAAATASCTCESGYRAVNHVNGWWGRDITCVSTAAYNELEAYQTGTSSQMVYRELPASQGSTLTIPESKVMQQLLMPSATACLVAVQASATEPRDQPYLEGNQACQAIGNLCVLHDYEASSAACTLYRYLQSQSVATTSAAAATTFNTNQQWKARMPGLYYPDRGVSALSEAAAEVPALLALPPSVGSRLRYVLAAYSLNGTYLGLTELKSQLQLCTGGASNPTAYLDFGTSMKLECNVPPANLLEVAEPVFYDLYFFFDTTSSSTLSARLADINSGYLYPVPVAVLNLRIDNQCVPPLLRLTHASRSCPAPVPLLSLSPSSHSHPHSHSPSLCTRPPCPATGTSTAARSPLTTS